MKKFKNVKRAYDANIRMGEMVMVAGRKFRMTKVGLKAQNSNHGEAFIGAIPGGEKYNKTSAHGRYKVPGYIRDSRKE